MLAALDGFANGQKVIPEPHREQLSRSSVFGISDSSFFDPHTSRDRHGPIPAYRDVEHIVQCSQQCIREQLDEDGWNVEVHHRVLCAALRRPYAPIKDGLINFSSTRTAALHKSLLKRTRTPSRMVDYCMYVDTAIAGAVEPAVVGDAVRDLRAISGYSTVNHTSYFHLRDNPVSLSIESKRPGGSVDDAQLQIGVWHAAQWAFLDEVTAKMGTTLKGLPFLPGFIVQGEHWYFVATTRNGKKTTVWTKQAIGTTSNTRGVYRVIRTIQYLAWWTETFYWSWFLANVLGLTEVENEEE
ncbi:hypothetical protein LY76DRAFT_527694 [Colletotrichum caudatum]|nr:hypothetical protein LY76DRAFT_527694 [Colletotrichum caudatum]